MILMEARNTEKWSFYKNIFGLLFSLLKVTLGETEGSEPQTKDLNFPLSILNPEVYMERSWADGLRWPLAGGRKAWVTGQSPDAT